MEEEVCPAPLFPLGFPLGAAPGFLQPLTNAPTRYAQDEIELLDDSEKTPVTLVTGFLGSGKTTLINYILKEQHGKKIAVIENEFGSLDIDSSLVKDKLQAKEDVISMDNGCVCCTVRGDLVKAFVTLSAREEKYDAVIIETTGMADPAPVAYTFNTKAEVGAQYRIDSILCVVDAKHVQQHLDEVRPTGVVNEAVNQVAFADKILLNKIDLVTPEEKAKVRESLASINAMAKVIETQQSRANLDELLGIGSFSLESVSHMLDNVLDEDEPEAQDGHAHTHAHGEGETCNHPSHGHGHAHAHGDAPTPKKPKRSEHLSGVSSVGIIVDGALDEQKFNGFMVPPPAPPPPRKRGVCAGPARAE
jgi:G3E family GTPase